MVKAKVETKEMPVVEEGLHDAIYKGLTEGWEASKLFNENIYGYYGLCPECNSQETDNGWGGNPTSARGEAGGKNISS